MNEEIYTSLSLVEEMYSFVSLVEEMEAFFLLKGGDKSHRLLDESGKLILRTCMTDNYITTIPSIDWCFITKVNSILQHFDI